MIGMDIRMHQLLQDLFVGFTQFTQPIFPRPLNDPAFSKQLTDHPNLPVSQPKPHPMDNHNHRRAHRPRQHPHHPL